jgi:hypothetical protein
MSKFSAFRLTIYTLIFDGFGALEMTIIFAAQQTNILKNKTAL